MTIANQKVKTRVFVLSSKFDVVINGQKAIRLFVLNIEFIRINSGGISGGMLNDCLIK